MWMFDASCVDSYEGDHIDGECANEDKDGGWLEGCAPRLLGAGRVCSIPYAGRDWLVTDVVLGLRFGF